MSVKRILAVLFHLLLVILLTALNQIGGLVYVLVAVIFRNRREGGTMIFLKRFSAFLVLYLLAAFVVVPIISPRKALPILDSNGLRPVTFLTCLLNRHYVVPEMYDAMTEVASDLDFTVQYMDANFPFFDGFPLLPHLSHDDGEKLDLAFQYGTYGSDTETLSLPTFWGYGSYSPPKEGEVDTPTTCEKKGNPFYSMTSIFPVTDLESEVNETRTKQLIESLVRRPEISKIYIEPHLKDRWGLSAPKVRFHGCQAVRHDDHIHIQL